MNIAYARRATADLAKIGAYSRTVFGDTIAAAVETYIRATVVCIAAMPESGKPLPRRWHTSRKPWLVEDNQTR